MSNADTHQRLVPCTRCILTNTRCHREFYGCTWQESPVLVPELAAGDPRVHHSELLVTHRTPAAVHVHLQEAVVEVVCAGQANCSTHT